MGNNNLWSKDEDQTIIEMIFLGKRFDEITSYFLPLHKSTFMVFFKIVDH